MQILQNCFQTIKKIPQARKLGRSIILKGSYGRSSLVELRVNALLYLSVADMAEVCTTVA